MTIDEIRAMSREDTFNEKQAEWKRLCEYSMELDKKLNEAEKNCKTEHKGIFGRKSDRDFVSDLRAYTELKNEKDLVLKQIETAGHEIDTAREKPNFDKADEIRSSWSEYVTSYNAELRQKWEKYLEIKGTLKALYGEINGMQNRIANDKRHVNNLINPDKRAAAMGYTLNIDLAEPDTVSLEAEKKVFDPHSAENALREIYAPIPKPVTEPSRR